MIKCKAFDVPVTVLHILKDIFKTSVIGAGSVAGCCLVLMIMGWGFTFYVTDSLVNIFFCSNETSHVWLQYAVELVTDMLRACLNCSSRI